MIRFEVLNSHDNLGVSCYFTCPQAGEEEDDETLSIKEATVDLPRSNATKRKPRQIFKSPPGRSR